MKSRKLRFETVEQRCLLTACGDVIFSDDFESEPTPPIPPSYIGNYRDFENWDVIGSGVDLVGPGGNFPPRIDSIMVDLDGTSGSTLITKQAFDLFPGFDYVLTFDLGGPVGGATLDTVVVELGGVFSESITIMERDAFVTFTRTIRVNEATTAKLSFADLGADSNGAFLDDVQLAVSVVGSPTAELVDRVVHVTGTPCNDGIRLEATSDGMIRVGDLFHGNPSILRVDAASVDRVFLELGDGTFDRLNVKGATPLHVDIDFVDTAGVDRILVERTEIRGNLTYRKTGPGHGTVTAHESAIGGFRVVVDEPGIDASLRAGFADSVILGDAFVQSGESLAFFFAQDSRVSGSIQVISGGGPIQTEIIRSTIIGKVHLTGGVNDDLVYIEESHLGHKLIVAFADGNDAVRITDGTVVSNRARLKFGRGDDTFETIDRGTNGHVLFESSLRVHLGLGDDQFIEGAQILVEGRFLLTDNGPRAPRGSGPRQR